MMPCRPKGLIKQAFVITKEKLRPLRDEFAPNIQDGIQTIDGDDSDREGKVHELISYLNMVEMKWKEFLNLEIIIEKKLAHVVALCWRRPVNSLELLMAAVKLRSFITNRCVKFKINGGHEGTYGLEGLETED